MYAVIPGRAALAYPCPACGQPLVPYGKPLTGSWEIEPCGNTMSCQRKPRVCTSCFGTKQRVVCTICLAGGCNGVHNFCLDCDGIGKATCPECEGGGIQILPGKQVRCPDCKGRGCGDCEGSGTITQEREVTCQQCEGREEISCPACQGTGKPCRR
jgi:hypothetical protein